MGVGGRVVGDSREKLGRMNGWIWRKGVGCNSGYGFGDLGIWAACGLEGNGQRCEEVGMDGGGDLDAYWVRGLIAGGGWLCVSGERR